MSNEPTRPPFKTAQRFFIIGILLGIFAGCGIGLGLYNYSFGSSRVVYQGGAYPSELTRLYQEHYLAMTVDSYIVNQNAETAADRFKSFSQVAQITTLVRQSANYAASGRAVEAQMVNQLAATLKTPLGWQDAVVKEVLEKQKQSYIDESNTAKAQAVDQFSVELFNAVPVVPETDPNQSATVAPQPQPAPAAPPKSSGGLFSGPYGYMVLLCLGLLIIIAIVFAILAIIRRQTNAQMNKRKEIVYEGEGKPPIMQWHSHYTFARNPYDESFTLETEGGDFLGEAGIGMNNVVPGSNSEKVRDFDVWVFDKTDINTYSRILMCEGAYNDEELRTRVSANPLAQAVLAEPNGSFTIDSQTMMIEIKIDEVDFPEDKSYFDNLKITMNIFLKDVDIPTGQMDIPDHLKA